MRTPITAIASAAVAIAALLNAHPAPAEESATIVATPRDSIRFTEQTRRGFDRSGRHVTSHTHADGSSSVHLNGTFQNVTVARMGPGGKIETYCTTDEDDAKSWMAREDDERLRVQFSPVSPGTTGATP